MVILYSYQCVLNFLSSNLNIGIQTVSANPNSFLGVPDITNIQPDSAFSDVKYSPSNTALATKWHIVKAHGLRPIWLVSTINDDY
jgi:hypothetical protein